MKMQHSKNSLYGILSALMLLNVALLFPSSANAQYQSKLPKCEGLNSNKWDLCYGEETSRNGVSYKGEYKDGYRHGFGIITYGNNEKYVGQFVQGRSEGRGTLFAADGRKLKEGAWENNEFVEVSSAELEERRRKAELEKLQGDLAAAKKAQLEAERGKADAENARRQAEANAEQLRAQTSQLQNAAKQAPVSTSQSYAPSDPKAIIFLKDFLWIPTQSSTGLCSDVIKSSKHELETFIGFNETSFISYLALTKSTNDLLRKNITSAHKHSSVGASYSFNGNQFSVARSGIEGEIFDFVVDPRERSITHVAVRCQGPMMRQCEKTNIGFKLQLPIKNYACRDDLPDRNMP